MADLATEDQVRATSNTSKRLTFFDLPREIRDIIYAHTLDNDQCVYAANYIGQIEDYPDQRIAGLRCRTLPWPHTLLLSRQFHKELLERFANSTCLMIEVEAKKLRQTARMPFGEYVKSVDLHFEAGCWYMWSRVEAEMGVRFVHDPCNLPHRMQCMGFFAIGPCTALPNIRSISINLYLPNWRYSDYCEQQLLEQYPECLSEFLDSSLIGGLNVYRLPLEADILDRDKTTLIMKWSTESKTLEFLGPKAGRDGHDDSTDDGEDDTDDDQDAATDAEA